MTGSRNVLNADPIRLTALASPIPEARNAVGNNSGRYTYTRLDAAERTPANTANRAVIAHAGNGFHNVSARLDPAAIQKLPIRKLRRDMRSTINSPSTAPPNKEKL